MRSTAGCAYNKPKLREGCETARERERGSKVKLGNDKEIPGERKWERSASKVASSVCKMYESSSSSSASSWKAPRMCLCCYWSPAFSICFRSCPRQRYSFRAHSFRFSYAFALYHRQTPFRTSRYFRSSYSSSGVGGVSLRPGRIADANGTMSLAGLHGV